jgi:hypothetical protein
MNNEVISFVIFDIELDFFRLNEVHRHNKQAMNNMVMMDRILNHLYQPIPHPIEKRKRYFFYKDRK